MGCPERDPAIHRAREGISSETCNLDKTYLIFSGLAESSSYQIHNIIVQGHRVSGLYPFKTLDL